MSDLDPRNAPFGTVLAPEMAVARYRDGRWQPFSVVPVAPFEIHPAAHVFHYGSSCFEGFKAFRQPDGTVCAFRMERHVDRLRQSARILEIPEPDPGQVSSMILEVIKRGSGVTPERPGALYIRPVLFGTMANIGAASIPSAEATLIVLASPVWDYFAGGQRPLRILVEERHARCAAHLGMVKTGANYAAALGFTLAAKRLHGVDQVLFCADGSVQETGASNFLLVREGHILTRGLDPTFLHGVTRDSLLQLAREAGYRVEERLFSVGEMVEWVKTGEAALAGTAAVLSGVGTLVIDGQEIPVGDGSIGPVTRRLREALLAVQFGEAPDHRGWRRAP
jgi:branched-chain amino acid aminotransferase